MIDDSFIPTTIVDIKRLARAVKREREVPHHLALDIASQTAGYRDISTRGKCFPHNHQSFKSPTPSLRAYLRLRLEECRLSRSWEILMLAPTEN